SSCLQARTETAPLGGSVEKIGEEEGEEEKEELGIELENMRGRSWASSSSSSASSEMGRLIQEHRSRDVKKADAMLVPTHFSFSTDQHAPAPSMTFRLICRRLE
ncbi:hypothetical protein LINGRAHAP2_LOCUS33145, partial [Linum grandiflorum]